MNGMTDRRRERREHQVDADRRRAAVAPRRLRALLVGGAAEVRRSVREVLARQDALAWEAESVAGAWSAIRRHGPDVLIATTEVLRGGGARFVADVRRFDERVEIVAVVDTSERGRRALRDGAYDFFVEPLDLDRLAVALRHIGETVRLREDADLLAAQDGGPLRIGGLVAGDPRMIRVLTAVRRLGRYDMPVLVIGEAGTEKEAIARALHALGRAGRAFVKAEAGALTSAELARTYGQARDGTLFIDDVTALPTEVTAALAAALSPDGAEPAEEGRVRIVAGCPEVAPAWAEPGTVRGDLHARLSGASLLVPPLRERRSDIPLVARVLMRAVAGDGGHAVEIGHDTEQALVAYDWPGNVDELQRVLAAAAALAGGSRIEPRHLPAPVCEERLAPSEDAPTRRLRDLEAQHLRQVLIETGGNKSRAARILGLTRWALQRRIRKHGIDESRPASAGSDEREPPAA